MDVAIAAMLAVINAVFGLVGSFDWAKKWTKAARICFFMGLSALGVGLLIWQAFRASQGNEENRKALLGDAERPPFIAVVSLPGNTRFVRVNSSDFPAYGITIQIYDDAQKNAPLRDYTDHQEMGAHTALLDEEPWVPADMVSSYHFTVPISTRTGVYSEQLILRRAGNNQWIRACRVMQGMRTLEEDVDSSWPRDKNGQLSWN